MHTTDVPIDGNSALDDLPETRASGRVPQQATKVVFVAGSGRSGTTLLDVMLGEIDGFFSAGELRWLWWAAPEGWQCGCGAPILKCDLWVEILENTFNAALSRIDFSHVLQLQLRSIRIYHLPRLLAQSPGRLTRWEALREYAEIAGRLYSAIGLVSGDRVIVDSSKNAAEAALLRLLPGLDPYVIHAVRDVRGVVNSMKKKVRMQPGGSLVESTLRSPEVTALMWDRKNLAAELARVRYRGRVRRIRYEDLLATPDETLRGIASFVGEPFEGVVFSGPSTIQLRGNHTVWGNPSRFRTGVTQLRLDDEWRFRLARRDKISSTALASPLLLRYRYPLVK